MEGIVLIEQIGQKKHEILHYGGKRTKAATRACSCSLTGRPGLEVITGHTGHMTYQGTSGRFLRMVNISAVLCVAAEVRKLHFKTQQTDGWLQ